MNAVFKTAVASVAGVTAAVGSALCCAGPLVAITLGLSGAGMATTFEPLRPYFVGGTLLSLGYGFFALRREETKACEPGTLCASPVARRRMRVLLWIATAVAVPLLSFPWWSPFVFQ
ncbi:MAG: mercuric transporter MerT family protein [Gemmatimonadaceae bacterium]